MVKCIEFVEKLIDPASVRICRHLPAPLWEPSRGSPPTPFLGCRSRTEATGNCLQILTEAKAVFFDKLCIYFFIAFVSGFFPVASLKAQESFPQELEENLSAGATAIYHLDFYGAEKHLNRAKLLRPNHPAPYFFLTMLRWYQLTYDSLENRNPTLEKIMENQADETIRTAKRSSSYLYWGGALGAKGFYHVTRSQWVRAYFAGKKGYSLVKKVVERDPELYDAQLGIGMYEYYAATLGPTLKALASFSIRGDKESALNLLRVVERKGRYVKLEASYFLWNAAMDEGRLSEAQEKAKHLTQTIPNSPLFKWCEIQTLFYQKKWIETIRKGEAYIRLALQGPQPEHYKSPHRLLLAKVYYHCGAASYNVRHFEQAMSYFKKAASEDAEFDGWSAMAHLRIGELLDRDGKREEAVREYKTVLRFPKVWDSHKLAKERIKKPFRANHQNGYHLIYSPLQIWSTRLQ